MRKFRTEKNKLHVWDFSRSIDECSAQKPDLFYSERKANDSLRKKKCLNV